MSQKSMPPAGPTSWESSDQDIFKVPPFAAAPSLRHFPRAVTVHLHCDGGLTDDGRTLSGQRLQETGCPELNPETHLLLREWSPPTRCSGCPSPQGQWLRARAQGSDAAWFSRCLGYANSAGDLQGQTSLCSGDLTVLRDSNLG